MMIDNMTRLGSHAGNKQDAHGKDAGYRVEGRQALKALGQE